MDIKDLVAAPALAAAEHDTDHTQEGQYTQEARRHVWDRHYASPDMRNHLDEKLASSSLQFQAAVAATERMLADEIADDNQRRARIRAENPNYFQDTK